LDSPKRQNAATTDFGNDWVGCDFIARSSQPGGTPFRTVNAAINAGLLEGMAKNSPFAIKNGVREHPDAVFNPTGRYE